MRASRTMGAATSIRRRPLPFSPTVPRLQGAHDPASRGARTAVPVQALSPVPGEGDRVPGRDARIPGGQGDPEGARLPSQHFRSPLEKLSDDPRESIRMVSGWLGINRMPDAYWQVLQTTMLDRDFFSQNISGENETSRQVCIDWLAAQCAKKFPQLSAEQIMEWIQETAHDE